MPIYQIRGISVDFPYDAYDCQIVYMEKVIQSLQEKCNALLESPTGTGKTLSLLCATLAWRRSLGPFSAGNSAISSQNQENDHPGVSSSQSHGQDFPKIVYTSRTHSQLRQVVQELKRTNYRPKMVVLGSREQLCIHDEVKVLRGKAQTNACHFLRKKGKERYCKHFRLVGEFVGKNPHLGLEPVDIEDLVNIGRSCGACPYYVSRELHKRVDILFAPYNYLIDPSYRKSLSINWQNSVLIFDEAHNLESLCADAASFDLPSTQLTACILEAKRCIDLSITRRNTENADDKNCDPDKFSILRALLLKLEKRISEVNIESSELGFTRPGPYIYELLSDLNITSTTVKKLIDTVDEAALVLEEDASSIQSKRPQEMKGSTCKLDSFGDILRMIFRNGNTSHAQYYRVHVQDTKSTAVDSSKGKVRTLSWWCFNPGMAMEAFSADGVGSIILTSGTLSPMDSFAQELKLEFPIRLENPHVISSDQIWVGVVPAGPSGYPLNSSFRTRDSPEYTQDLGNAIVNFARIVPDGLLVFFPSYYLMGKGIDFWKDNDQASTTSSTVWERICKYKQPVVEPRQSSLFSASIDDYMCKLKDTCTSGAIFFAVCRGKVSEGLDFSDHAGRAVIVTGLPFATRTDPKVRLKREFLDEQAWSQKQCYKILTGEEWYDQQASRAVNQAVGRVIRHRHDYGAILFCDERFASAHRQSQISRWIQPHIKCYSRYGDVVYSLTHFFRNKVDDPLKKNERSASFYGKCSSASTQIPGCFFPVNSCLPDKLVLEKCCKTPFASDNDIRLGESSRASQMILPANQSFIGLRKRSQSSYMESSSHCSFNENKKLLSGTLFSVDNSEVVDLASNSPLNKNFNDETVANNSAKRCKLLKLEHSGGSLCKEDYQQPTFDVQTARKLNSHTEINSYRQAPSLSSDTRNMNKEQLRGNIPVLSGFHCEGRLSAQTAQGITSSCSSGQEQEAKGTSFLVQVKKKLTVVEYSEFVSCMKALKSKEMKIGPVIQSIVRLFSSAERLPLLRRFRYFIPQKYHALYDQHCTPNKEEMAGHKIK